MGKDILGVDIGGVIISRGSDTADTSLFGDRYLHAAPVPGAAISLARLAAGKFGDRIWLVSKCGQRVQDKSLAWLEHNKFWERTAIPPGQARFCRERSGKADIADELGLTHFIDDRLEVLGYLGGVSNLYLFQPQRREMQEHREHLPRVQIVRSWTETVAAILGSLAVRRAVSRRTMPS